MGQALHGSATTTEAVRRANRHRQASLRELARRFGVDPETIAKWRKRTSVADLPTGPSASAAPRHTSSFAAHGRPSRSASTQIRTTKDQD
jgi:transposase-like protein